MFHCLWSASDTRLLSAKSIAEESIIYIDSELDDDKHGEIEARKIFEKGFKNIILTTAHRAEKFDTESLPWIGAIIGKEPPWLT